MTVFFWFCSNRLLVASHLGDAHPAQQRHLWASERKSLHFWKKRHHHYQGWGGGWRGNAVAAAASTLTHFNCALSSAVTASCNYVLIEYMRSTCVTRQWRQGCVQSLSAPTSHATCLEPNTEAWIVYQLTDLCISESDMFNAGGWSSAHLKKTPKTHEVSHYTGLKTVCTTVDDSFSHFS